MDYILDRILSRVYNVELSTLTLDTIYDKIYKTMRKFSPSSFSR